MDLPNSHILCPEVSWNLQTSILKNINEPHLDRNRANKDYYRWQKNVFLQLPALNDIFFSFLILLRGCQNDEKQDRNPNTWKKPIPFSFK